MKGVQVNASVGVSSVAKDKRYFELREMAESSYLSGDKDKALEKSKELDKLLNEKQIEPKKAKKRKW